MTGSFTQEELERSLEQELNVFQKDKKYDFTEDLRDAYSRSLQVPVEKRILDKIPDHVFWDIKTPQTREFDDPIIRKGRYNPIRGREADSYFMMRDNEEYFHSQHQKNYLNDACTHFRRY